jgi:hypothetical protein
MWKGLSLLAANEVGGAIRRNVLATGIYGMAGIVGLIGVVFGLVAFQGWLSLRMSAIEADLLIAGLLLGVALLIAIVGAYTKHRRRTSTALTASALLAAPIAAGVIGKRLNLGTIALIGVVALGAMLGRQLGRD